MAKRAIQTLVRGEDGRQKLLYVDADTGEVVPAAEIEDYEIITAGGDDYWGQEVTPAKPTEDKPAEEDSGKGEPKFQQIHESAYHDADRAGAHLLNTTPANPLNNFGFMEKPRGFSTAANLLPGPGGLIAKGIDKSINAANLGSVNKAREFLGLEPKGIKDSLRDVLRGPTGQVADVNINRQDYSVGFDALSPSGRTNLTPDEARKRSLTLGGLSEVPARDKEPGLAKSVVGKAAGGILEKVTGLGEGWAGNLIESIFGGKNESKPITPTSARFEEPVSREVALKDITNRSGRPTSFAEATGIQPITDQRLGIMGPIGDVGLNFRRPGADETGLRPDVHTAALRVAADDFGSLNINSGYRSPEHNRAVNGRPNSEHLKGNALDIDMTGLSPGERQDLIREFAERGATRFGTYTGSNAIHIDFKPTSDGGLHFMHDMSIRNIGNAEPWMQDAYQTYARGGVLTPNERGIGIPTRAERGNPNASYMSTATKDDTVSSLDPIGTSLDPIKSSSVINDLAGSVDNYAQQAVRERVQEGPREARSFRDASPAEFAANGFIERTPDQISRISEALAGELSGEQLKALEAGDPVAQRELANMVTTIENRAASRSFETLDEVLAGSQYNSMLSGNIGVTSNNYNLYKDVLNTNIADFYKNELKPDNYGFTNYHAPYADPVWGEKMDARTQTGSHMFGILGPAQGDPTYTPRQSFLDARDTYATYGDRLGQGTFGTSSSPGVGRSSLNGFLGSDSGYSDRSAQGTFGTSSSPGVGRSSLGGFSESGGGGALGGTRDTAHSMERERDTSLSGGGFSSGSRSTSNHSAERERDTSLSSRSPTNDGYAGSKTPGGGF